MVVAGIGLAAFLLGMTGCARNEQGGGGGGDAALIAAGKTAFSANNCGRCHAVGGQGGGRAPDLSHVGAEAGRTPEWLTAHIKNPKTHNPTSRMPAFEGRINEADLHALGVYLASLK